MKKFLALVAVLAVLMSLAVPALAADGASAGTNNASTSSTTTSPQTGFDATVWVVTAAGLLLCAGYCFIRAKKVTE